MQQSIVADSSIRAQDVQKQEEMWDDLEGTARKYKIIAMETNCGVLCHHVKITVKINLVFVCMSAFYASHCTFASKMYKTHYVGILKHFDLPTSS